MNYYEILEISSNSDTRSIKKHYYQLSKKYHPDKNNGKSDEKFKLLSEAYSTLSNPKKRYLYDIKLIYLKILSIVVPFSLLISFLFYCLSPFFTIFLNDRTILYSLKYMSFGILPLSIIYINSECFRGFKNISLYTIFKFTLIPFLSSIILFLLNNFGNNNIEILIIAYLISICIVCIILYLIVILY